MPLHDICDSLFFARGVAITFCLLTGFNWCTEFLVTRGGFGARLGLGLFIVRFDGLRFGGFGLGRYWRRCRWIRDWIGCVDCRKEVEDEEKK